MEETVKSKTNTTDHLANERTLLAWIRTSIAIMAFGFVVVKFSLFIRQVSLLLDTNVIIPASRQGYSSLIGILLVSAGAIILPISYWKYKQTEKKINHQKYHAAPLLFPLLVSLLFIISLLLVAYLVENNSRF